MVAEIWLLQISITRLFGSDFVEYMIICIIAFSILQMEFFGQHHSSGQFSIKSAYNMLSSELPTLDYSRFIWLYGSPTGGCIFLWKLWMRPLPLTDNLRVWQAIFPSQCAFCRSHSDTQDHLFLQCPAIQPLWQELAILLSGPMPRQLTIRAYLIRWWRVSSSKTMIGQLRVVASSLAAWVMW